LIVRHNDEGCDTNAAHSHDLTYGNDEHADFAYVIGLVVGGSGGAVTSTIDLSSPHRTAPQTEV